ncbi:hypothetical protein RJ639_003949 [Escallonia herrerae]|uniref:Uncharacterized protein n=1 Tax=Escallonia herrerae TaxID=1293975 RepID=A0AA88W4T0_9ASTE|nr:hypothetical protein RJ639_003949 [Escallonia herrerae]
MEANPSAQTRAHMNTDTIVTIFGSRPPICGGVGAAAGCWSMGMCSSNLLEWKCTVQVDMFGECQEAIYGPRLPKRTHSKRVIFYSTALRTVDCSLAIALQPPLPPTPPPAPECTVGIATFEPEGLICNYRT